MAKRVFKSKKKLSSTRANYRKWSEWDTGDILIGTYKGSQTDSYDKPNWLIEVEDAQFGDKKAAKKLNPNADGEKNIIGLNSSGKLDAAMDKVEIGDMVQIEYKGMSTIEKGKYKGKDAHDIEVDLVEEEGDEDEDEDETDERYEKRTRGDSDDDDEEEEDEDDL